MIEYIGKNKARFRVSIGSTSKGTRQIRTKTVTYNKKKELEKMYQDFENECRMIVVPVDTVSDLLHTYMESLHIKGIRATTMRGYSVCEKRINSVLGNLSAQGITTYQINDFISRMAKQGLSAKTIKNTVSFLSSAYKYGMRSQMLTDNPCVLAVIPKRVQPDINIVEENNLADFMVAISKEPLDIRLCCELALYLGLRRSEIMGLKEEDINFEEKTISINKTRHYVDGEHIIQPTKTERSRRTLAVPDFLLSDLLDIIEYHHSLDYTNTDFLIQLFGEPMKPEYISQTLSKFIKKNNLPTVTLHGLRHTFATMLNASGEFDIAEISSVLGHSNINVTLGVYTHTFEGASNAAKSVANFINQKGYKKDTNSESKTPETE